MTNNNSSSVDISYHFPPELLELLYQTIPILGKPKEFPIQFFRGAGVPESYLGQWREKLRTDRNNVNKYHITRDVLTQLSEGHDKMLGQRREVLKRVVEFEDFTACWENERLNAEGLVARIRSLVNVKDSFTRMNIEREKERDEHRKKYQAEAKKLEDRTRERQALKAEFYALFPMTDSQKRGKSLESILNHIFSHYSMLVKEAFTVKGLGYDGVVEQIDGLIELDSHLYFVEMKWWNKPIGVAEVAQPLVRVFSRPNETRCIFISASGYTEPAIETFRQATQQRICIMCGLQEVVQILESEKDLRDLIRKKTQAAIVHRNPWHQCFNEL